ncbi:MAG: hypothetical protein H8E87_03240 [FCB group bacterium]|nr:hypothetical protein [FCB group bacterium]
MRKITLVAVFLLLAASLAFSEYYAVVITGCTPDPSSVSNPHYGGDIDPPLDSYDCFWNDTFLMWEALFQAGWNDENIFVLFGEGVDWVDPLYDNERYIAEELYYIDPWFIDHITDYSAYLADVENIFTWLAEGNPAQGITQMTEDDFLFVWTFDHGCRMIGHWWSGLQLMGEGEVI